MGWNYSYINANNRWLQKNIDKPKEKELYININKDIINKEIDLFIKYHKKLILNNELIIDIYKYLTN